jgi:hypothetical protein
MRGPKDALGNEIQQGHWIGLKTGDQFLIGQVVHLNNGGIDLASPNPNKVDKTAGQMIIRIDMPVVFPPETRIGQLFRLVDPNAQAVVEEMANEKKDEQPKKPGPVAVPGITK